jgi:hypothetical protein
MEVVRVTFLLRILWVPKCKTLTGNEAYQRRILVIILLTSLQFPGLFCDYSHSLFATARIVLWLSSVPPYNCQNSPPTKPVIVTSHTPYKYSATTPPTFTYNFRWQSGNAMVFYTANSLSEYQLKKTQLWLILSPLSLHTVHTMWDPTHISSLPLPWKCFWNWEVYDRQDLSLSLPTED